MNGVNKLPAYPVRAFLFIPDTYRWDVSIVNSAPNCYGIDPKNDGQLLDAIELLIQCATLINPLNTINKFTMSF